MLAPVTHRFGRFELDLARAELRADGTAQPLEPQVFALLALLVENGDRLVAKDEIVEKVWDGRIVSDSAITSRIKSARRALGDDGKAQRFIKTVHRRGVRFVAPVTVVSEAGPLAVAVGGAPDTGVAVPADPIARPSIAVLPFQLVGPAGPWAAIGEALPHELIAELSRLRWLLVTARGSSFRLRAPDLDPTEVGRLLGVRYCLTGTVETSGARLTVTTTLSDTRRANVVWAERFAGAIDDVHRMRDDIRGRVLAELEIRIPSHEAALARLAVPDDLDAWAAFHLGLQHMYRFNRQDNAAARALFERALAREPGFARAHAGLSFVHFQSAFLRYTDDPAGEAASARRCAERGLELDALDPFVNFTMGRSFWLVGDLDGSFAWLDRATAISPSYASTPAPGPRAWRGGRRRGGTRRPGDAPQPARPAVLRDARHARARAPGDGGGRRGGRLGGARRPLAGRARADRHDRGGRDGPRRRRHPRRGMGRQRAGAQPDPRPGGLLPVVPDAAAGASAAGREGPGAARLLSVARAVRRPACAGACRLPSDARRAARCCRSTTTAIRGFVGMLAGPEDPLRARAAPPRRGSSGAGRRPNRLSVAQLQVVAMDEAGVKVPVELTNTSQPLPLFEKTTLSTASPPLLPIHT